jgi:hypothetical protein
MRRVHDKLSRMGALMSHYAKLAALAFRWLGVAILFYALPALVAFASSGMFHMSRQMPMMAFIGLLHPILAVILIIAARPLGELTARGIE